MYGMGGGFGGGWGGYQQYQPQAPSGADQGNARIDKLRNRVSNLQEQWKGAGTEQQAGIQGRIDQMQGRIKGLRQDRRQGEGLYAQPQAGAQGQQGGAQPEPARYGGGNQMNGMAQYFGQLPQGFGQQQGGYGMNPWAQQSGGMGMAGFGGWAGQQFGYNPGANFRPSDPNQINLMGPQQSQAAPQGKMPAGSPVAPRPQQGGAPQSYYEGSQFNTQFGNLVPASVGNGNIYKQNGSDGQDLFHYDPQAGWKHMTNQEYQGYNNPASFYQDPNQYAAQAGGNRNDYQMRNGMWQTQLGTGTYR